MFAVIIGVAIVWRLGLFLTRVIIAQPLFQSMLSGAPRLSKEAPHVPAELARALWSGECVLYAGAGLSAQAGLPVWSSFVTELLDWVTNTEYVPAALHRELTECLESKRYSEVANRLVGGLPERRESLCERYRQQVKRIATLSRAHQVLGELPFCGLMTTNYDNLLEQTFAGRPAILTPRDRHILGAMTRGTFGLMKLYGDLDRPETLSLSPSEFRRAMTGNAEMLDLGRWLFQTRTMLLVGASLDGLLADLEAIAPDGAPERRHFAVICVEDEPEWHAKSEALSSRFNIETLAYHLSDEQVELHDFLQKLARTATKKLHSAATS